MGKYQKFYYDDRVRVISDIYKDHMGHVGVVRIIGGISLRYINHLYRTGSTRVIDPHVGAEKEKAVYGVECECGYSINPLASHLELETPMNSKKYRPLSDLQLNYLYNFRGIDVRKWLSEQNFDERSIDILIKRYGLYGHNRQTYAQIAESLGLSTERIRQIIRKAERKLMKYGKLDKFAWMQAVKHED
jgi:hypothetical protein